jgi:hypothetical protein
MRRHIAAALLALLPLALLGISPQANAATPEQWHQLADKAAAEIATVKQVLDSNGGGNAILVRDITSVTLYAAWKWGWQDARTQTWLNRIYSLRKPDGGYGLNYTWDWNNDGSVNPVSTSYTITTAGHAGPVLLAGYDGGVVPGFRLTDAARSILNTPLTSWSSSCVSYSNNPPDARVACVWNINAYGAWFLWEVGKRGLIPAGRETEATNKLRAWRDLTRANFKTALRGWTYQHTTSALQDPWHNMATVEPMSLADPTIKEAATNGQLANWPTQVINLTFLKPGLDKMTCAQAEGYYSEVNRRANVSYNTQYERLTTRSGALGLAMLVIRYCHP